MKKYAVIIIILFATGAIQKQYADTNKILWRDFKQGFYAAQQAKKPLLVYIYSDYCGYCRKMETEILADPKVIQALNSHYISVSINTNAIDTFKKHITEAYKADSGIMLQKMIGTGGVPRTIFLDKDGKLLAAFPGYGTSFKTMFFDLLGYIKDNCYVIDYPFNQYQAQGHCKKK